MQHPYVCVAKTVELRESEAVVEARVLQDATSLRPQLANARVYASYGSLSSIAVTFISAKALLHLHSPPASLW